MSTTPYSKADVPVPEALQADTIEARMLKQKIWKRCNVDNLNFMGALVGREGSGKSLTALKIAESVDPSFNASRVMFEPEAFLKRLREWKDNDSTKGKMVVADEAGVGLGVRTWYQKDQILFNQVLQVIRDENMGILFTLPRLNELDSQARGRLHAFMEMTDKDDGNWAELKFLNWKPTRDERDKIYRQYPQLRVNGVSRPVKRLRLSLPSETLIEEYQQRKNDFQDDLYQRAIDEAGEEEGDVDEMTVKDVAMEIAKDKMSSFVSRHNQTKQPFINKNLIRAEYEVSHADASTVKSLLEQRFSDEQLEEYA